MEILFGVVLVFLVFVLWRVFILERRLGRLFGSAKNPDVASIVAGHAEALSRIESELGRVASSHKALSESFTSSIQKVSMIRFNPFSDSGGDQSFSIALLDGQNNGIIISGLYVQGGPMVYAKPVEQGKPRYALSAEEASVLAKAMSA